MARGMLMRQNRFLPGGNPPGGVTTSSAWLSRFYGEPGVVGSTVKAGLRIPTDFDGIPSLVL